jgi:hypothetical protein
VFTNAYSVSQCLQCLPVLTPPRTILVLLMHSHYTCAGYHSLHTSHDGREDIEVKSALNSKLDALEEDLSDLVEARTEEAEVSLLIAQSINSAVY